MNAKPSSACHFDGMPGKVLDATSRGSFPTDRDNRCTGILLNRSGAGRRSASNRPSRCGSGNSRRRRPRCNGFDGAALERLRNRRAATSEWYGNPYKRRPRAYAPKFAKWSWGHTHWSRDTPRRPRNVGRASSKDNRRSTPGSGPGFRYAGCRDHDTFRTIDRPGAIDAPHAGTAFHNPGGNAGRHRHPSRTRHPEQLATRHLTQVVSLCEKPALAEASRGPNPARSAVHHGT